MPVEQLLNEREIALVFGRAVPTLQKDRLRGEGPPYIKIGRLVRYSPTAVPAWLDSQVRRSTPMRPPRFERLTLCADIRATRPFGLPDGSKGRDVCDWAGDAVALAALAAGAEAYEPQPARANGHAADSPLPLFPPLPAAEPYPLEALGPTLSRAAKAVARKVQVPPAIAAQSVLATASLATCAHADVMLPYGQRRPLALFFMTAAASGDRDLWWNQGKRVEVWVEKSALVGVIEPVCQRWRVPYFAARGYPSHSELYAAGKRFDRYYRVGSVPVVFYLGDHDPSGLDMTRSLREELWLYARKPVEVRQLALNIDQIQELNLPPNPAKETDKRYQEYARTTGQTDSWELDALSPAYIDELVDSAVTDLVDEDKWSESVDRENANRGGLYEMVGIV